MGWSLFGQAAVVLTNQGVSVLVNMFFSVAANAAMGISNQITHIVSNFVNSFQTAFQPQITKLYVKRDFDELVRLTIQTSRMSSYLVMFFMVPIIFQVDNFLTLWLGEYPEYAVEFCIYTLLGIFVDSCSAPLWMIIFSDKHIKSYQVGQACIFIQNFILSWLVLKLGFPPYSVILVRIFVYILATTFRIIKTKEKVLIFPILLWLRKVIGKAIFVMLPPALIMVLLSTIQFDAIWLDFLINCSVCVIIMSLSILLIGLEKNERMMLLNKIKTKIKNRI